MGEGRRCGRLHLDGALGPEVGLEHVLKALGCVDVHLHRRRFVEHLRVRVQHAERHGCWIAESARLRSNRRLRRRRRRRGREAVREQ
jgi:hypothetical protein